MYMILRVDFPFPYYKIKTEIGWFTEQLYWAESKVEAIKIVILTLATSEHTNFRVSPEPI